MISYLVKLLGENRKKWEWLVFYCRKYMNNNGMMKGLRFSPPQKFSSGVVTIMAKGLC